MRRLNKPTQDAGETFASCVSIVRNPEMRRHLEALRTNVEAASNDFEAKGLLAEWHLIAQTGSIGPVPKEELVATYNSRMARPNTPGRLIYDELIIVPQRRCPLCGQRDVSTLDHYLPESRFTLLVVSPINLVPACKDCNYNKRSAVPSSATEQTFHPYYDNFDDGVWVKAILVKSDPLGVLYEVERSQGWSSEKFARASNHFEMLELGALYSDHAVSELGEIKRRLRNLYEAGGAIAVREDLGFSASSITGVHVNSWRGALYTAAAANNWFCDGGFEAIAE